MTGAELYQKLSGMLLLPNAYEEWADYREKVTNYIIEHSEKDRSIAILGAGRCNDLDLAKLKEHFSFISLFDRDENAMKEAVSRYGIENDPDVDIQVRDFVGISDEDYASYADLMIKEMNKKGRETDLEDVAPLMLEKLEEIFAKTRAHNSDIGIQQYDYATVLGVHSQLLNMLVWIWAVGLSNIGKTEKTVEDRIKREDLYQVKKLNDDINMLVRKGFFLGCEMSRTGAKGGVEGALQAMGDINKRNEKHLLKINNVATLNWPLNRNENINYQMCLLNIAVF